MTDHRHALAEEHGGDEIAQLTLAQFAGCPGRRSGPRHRSSTSGCGSRRRCCRPGWPRCACRCRTTRSRSVKPSCAVTKLTLATGRRPDVSYRSAEPVMRAANSPTVPGLAAPEVADGVAVLAVPLGPLRREVADLVAAGADVPRLGDQLQPATDDRVLLHELEEGRQPVDVVELARQRRRRDRSGTRRRACPAPSSAVSP